MDRLELLSALKERGLRPCPTVSPKWDGAIHGSVGTATILVLFRRRGVDVLLTHDPVTHIFTEKGQARVRTKTEGTCFVEMHYMESEIAIHDRALKIADKFLRGETIEDNYLAPHGVSIGQLRQRHEAQRREEAFLYDELCVEDGRPAYLADGVSVLPGDQLAESW